MGPSAQSKSDQGARFYQNNIYGRLDHGWNRISILQRTPIAERAAAISDIIIHAIIINPNAMLIGCGDTMLIGTNFRQKLLHFDSLYMHIPPIRVLGRTSAAGGADVMTGCGIGVAFTNSGANDAAIEGDDIRSGCG